MLSLYHSIATLFTSRKYWSLNKSINFLFYLHLAANDKEIRLHNLQRRGYLPPHLICHELMSNSWWPLAVELSTVFVWEHVVISVTVIHFLFILKNQQSSGFWEKKKVYVLVSFKSIFLCCIFYLSLYTVLTPELYGIWVSIVQIDFSGTCLFYFALCLLFLSEWRLVLLNS